MVIVTEFNVTANFRYLWLKYVTDINLKVHCARSLVGKYSTKVKNTKGDQVVPMILDEAEAKYYYLCGVTAPYRWANNFHLAFKEAEGKELIVERHGIRIVIQNAEEIPITDEYIAVDDPNAHKREFCTCRNWQFAHMIRAKRV